MNKRFLVTVHYRNGALAVFCMDAEHERNAADYADSLYRGQHYGISVHECS